MISEVHWFQLRLFAGAANCVGFRLAGVEICGAYYRYDDFVV